MLTVKSAATFVILDPFRPTVNALVSKVYFESTKVTSSPVAGEAGKVMVKVPPDVSAKI